MNLGNRHSQHNFAQIPSVNMARSQFDRSFTVKDTMDFDYLVPIFCDDIIPGDSANLSVNTFMRLATQKVPIMDNMYVDFFFFFVPNRLVMNNWEKLNGAQTDPGDSTDFICPQMTFAAGGPEVGSIYDKFGLPTDIAAGYTIRNTLMFRAYYKIWNDWFRDQNLQDSLVIPLDDGPDAPADFELQKRNKKHDYFTSMLPSPQKGPAVELPLGTRAPVLGIGKFNQNFPIAGGTWYESDGTTTPYANSSNIDAVTADYRYVIRGTAATGGYPDIYADLTGATAATINQLREAIQMQSLFELDARGGTRYVEILQAHFNVVSPDFRLQRPEYLGGGQIRINSHPVAQTAPTAGADAQGQLAAFATASSQGSHIGFSKAFVEHGFVIGLASARADITYQQGVNRMFMRSTRYDHFWPKLQELGEEAVPNIELFTQGTADDGLVGGYQERYASYRYKPSEIRGQFRSTYVQSLDMWHMAEEFASLPLLNSDFIESNTPIERAIAVTDAPHLLCDYFFQYKHARPMLTYSVPSTLGRF